MEEACKNGDLDTVKYLAKKEKYITLGAMTYAAEYGHYEVVKYLCEIGAPNYTDTIIYASMRGHVKIVKYLFEKGASIDVYAIHWALRSGRIDVVKYLVSVNAPQRIQDSEKISVIINDTRKYRTLILPILEYKLGHPSYIILDYLEYSF